MKIWIDVLTPKQALFFGAIAEKLDRHGCSLLVTYREFKETEKLLSYKLLKYSPIKVGVYGGGSLVNKLRCSLERSLQLLPIVREFNPDIVISYCSPEAARVAFGLAKPHYAICDIPQASAVLKLTLPLSERLYSPWIIPKGAWTKYGINSRNIFRYRGLDPIAWLNNYNFNRSVLEELGIGDSPYIVVRSVEQYASYQLSILNKWVSRIDNWIYSLLRELREYKVVILCRYEDQVRMFRKLFKEVEQIVVPEEPVDGPSLLKFSSLFIGYGGTMTMEAALLGIPSISLRPGNPPYYIKYLVRKGLVVYLKREENVVNTVISLLSKREKISRLARKLYSKLEDPADYISKSVLGILE
mgnify:CR=1 FL=1